MESTVGHQTAISVKSKPKPNVPVRNNKRKSGKYFKEYCENTGIHGFRYLVEKRSFCERLLWAVLIIISIVACCYVINRIYKKYDQSPVIVSFATQESAIFTVPFPAVTICPMSKTMRSEYNYTKAIHKIKANVTLTPEEYKITQYLSLICEEDDSITEYFPDNETFSDELFKTLDELKLPLISLFPCEFMGYKERCSNIFKYIITDQGICYTFNMFDREEIFKDNVAHYSDYHTNEYNSTWNVDEGYTKDSKVDAFPRRALLSGADNALKIVLFQFTQDIDYLCAEDVQGYSVALHTPQSIPRPNKQYFQVPFDTSVIAAIQPKMMTTSVEVENYDPIVRKCYFAHEKQLKFFRIYTPENCRLECLTNYTLEQCGCVNFFMPRENTTSICGNGNIDCMQKAEKQLIEIELENLIDPEASEDHEIYCDCMALCTELSYDMEQSHTEWNWHEQLKAQGVENYEGWKREMKLAKLTVFFKQEQFLTSQRNELYGPIDFLANFGGLLGLFTGFSLLSLIEIIYFLTVRILCNLRQDKVWNGTEK